MSHLSSPCPSPASPRRPSHDTAITTIVGVLVHLAVDADRATVRAALDALPGVEAHELDVPYQLALSLEATSLDAAHEVLTSRVRTTPGVAAAWPLATHYEPSDLAPASDEAAPLVMEN